MYVVFNLTAQPIETNTNVFICGSQLFLFLYIKYQNKMTSVTYSLFSF